MHFEHIPITTHSFPFNIDISFSSSPLSPIYVVYLKFEVWSVQACAQPPVGHIIKGN